MQKNIRIGAVSYLNTKPLMYAFKHGFEINGMEITEEYPAKIAQMLLNDEIDVGLVPVAIIPKLKEYFIISDYCIGAEGAVASVCLFSEVPLEKIQKVILDYQSKTSVALAKILIQHYWKLNVLFDEATENFRDEIRGTTAAVVIGDRLLSNDKYRLTNMILLRHGLNLPDFLLFLPPGFRTKNSRMSLLCSLMKLTKKD